MATLKISELSVGDWVYYDKGNTPYSISGIYRTDRQDCVVLDDKEYADGVIVTSANASQELIEYAKQAGKRVLDYQEGDEKEIFDNYKRFYDEL